MTKFIVKLLYDGNENSRLEYNLYDNPVVDTFIETVNFGSDVPIYHTSMTFSKSEVVNNWVEMYQLAKKLAEFPAYSNSLQFNRVIEEGYSQDLLNHLHWFVEEFEVLDLKGEMPDEYKSWVGPAISRINDLIHNMENDFVGYNSSWLGFRMEPFKKIPITQEHLQYFTPDYAKHKLFLGYSEVGKTLKHMYEAKDTEAAKRGQSNPKAHITNEVMIPYFNSKLNYPEYEIWCQQHTPEDPTDPRQYCQFEIGELVDPTNTEIKKFNGIAVEIT
jgi:hypothetical protein